MSKKKKSHYVTNETKVVGIGEKITFNKNLEENHMTPEWFYLNDITWFKAVDGRIVAPVKGVVTHLDAPTRELRFMSVGIAKQCIVDVAPFGKCYEKQALESLWDSLHGRGVPHEECEKSSENRAEFVNCQKFSEDLDEAKSEEAENG